MKFFALVNAGLEETAQKEIKEILNAEAKIYPRVLEFEVKLREDAIKLIYHSQSIRRIIFSLGQFKDQESIDFGSKNKLKELDWADFFSSGLTFKVEVENVKGQENRNQIAHDVAGKIYSQLEKSALSPQIQVKKPDFLVIVFFNGREYFIGVDLAGVELNSRYYRVFPHSASFKGDLAYFFVRKSGFMPGSKLLVGFMKDCALAIEAAIFSQGLLVHNAEEKNFSFYKFPFFRDLTVASLIGLLSPGPGKAAGKESGKKEEAKNEKVKIFAFDESPQSYIASKKNAQLAKISQHLSVSKYSLDELDVKFSENEFDVVIFQVTTKDESKINEIYYQAGYVLKKKGRLLLIGRKAWPLSVSSKFRLLSTEEVQRGDFSYKFWLQEKL